MTQLNQGDESPQQIPTAPPTVSADGGFYWDGQQWLPREEAPAREAPARDTTAQWGCVVVIILGVLGAAIWGASQHATGVDCPSGQFCVTVDHWQVRSSDVSGKITNATGRGCSDPEITLHLLDHNDAIVRDFTFGAGDLANGAERNWTTHMVGLLYVDAPVESNVTHITVDATCADQHA